jgi:tRNA (adenine22-N1)-methyltransferase
MMLSERLKRIADEISQGETMADIGTDHGFLPVYLSENGISPHVVLADVSPGSLDKARENCRMNAPDAAFDFRLGSGLEVLSSGEVDAVVIAGMGGLLITEILAADPEKSSSFKKFVLQPRNNVGRLRVWLVSHGFDIVREQLVRERQFICEILTAAPAAGDPAGGRGSAAAIYRKAEELYGEDPETTAFFDFPDTLAQSGEALLEEYLTRQLEKYSQIADKIRRNHSRTASLRVHEARIRRIRAILNREEEQ